LVARFLLPSAPAVTVIGVDEETAVVGGPGEWTVHGRQSAWRLTRQGREQLTAGTTFSVPVSEGVPGRTVAMEG